MRFVLALVVAVCVAGVAMADIPPSGPRLSAPGGWCGSLMGGLTAGMAVTFGGLWFLKWRRRNG